MKPRHREFGNRGKIITHILIMSQMLKIDPPKTRGKKLDDLLAIWKGLHLRCKQKGLAK